MLGPQSLKNSLFISLFGPEPVFVADARQRDGPLHSTKCMLSLSGGLSRKPDQVLDCRGRRTNVGLEEVSFAGLGARAVYSAPLSRPNVQEELLHDFINCSMEGRAGLIAGGIAVPEAAEATSGKAPQPTAPRRGRFRLCKGTAGKQ